jgi:hypothetical protein
MSSPEPWALSLLGAGFFLMGLDGVVTDTTTTGVGKSRMKHYGASARLRGAAFAFIGLVVSSAGLVEILGLSKANELLSGPRGLGLTIAGWGVLGAFGGGILLSESIRKTAWLAWPGRLLGGLLLFVSLAASALGGVLALRPGLIQTLFGAGLNMH